MESLIFKKEIERYVNYSKFNRITSKSYYWEIRG